MSFGILRSVSWLGSRLQRRLSRRGLTRWQSRAHQQINSDLVKAAVVLNRLEAKLDSLGPS